MTESARKGKGLKAKNAEGWSVYPNVERRRTKGEAPGCHRQSRAPERNGRHPLVGV